MRMPHVTDISMVQVGQQCKHLKELIFSYMTGITDVSIVVICQHCHQLEELTLEGCESISDISMQSIAENCQNLTYLQLHNMSGLVNPSYIADIARNNIRLKYDYINIEDCGGRYETPLNEMLQAITAGR
jgi:hypothetical protein